MIQNPSMHGTYTRVLVIASLTARAEATLELQLAGSRRSGVDVLDLALPHGQASLWLLGSWLVAMARAFRGVQRAGAVVLHDSLPRTSALAAFSCAFARILSRPVLPWERYVAAAGAIPAERSPAPPSPQRPVRRFLYLGPVSSARGVTEILDASYELRNLPFRVDLVGPLGDGFTEETFRDSYRVHYRGTGDGSTRRRALLECDALLLPPRRIGPQYARIVREAFASGRPIVATRCGILPELVEEGVSGILVPPRDAAGLARAMRRLIQSPDLLRTLRRGASRSAARVAGLARADELAGARADARRRWAFRPSPGWSLLSLRRRPAPAARARVRSEPSTPST